MRATPNGCICGEVLHNGMSETGRVLPVAPHNNLAAIGVVTTVGGNSSSDGHVPKAANAFTNIAAIWRVKDPAGADSPLR